MRVFDFSIQTLLFVAVLLSTLTGKEFPVWLALIQFFVGLWQLISALINTAQRSQLPREFRHRLNLYWLGVLVYFVVLALLYVTLGSISEWIPGIWFLSAWILAVYYYVWSYQMAHPKKETHSFLDIANK